MKEKIIWGIIGALTIAVLLGIFWLGKWHGAKKCTLPLQEPGEKKVSVQESGAVAIEQAVPAGESAGDEPANAEGSEEKSKEQKTPVGWKTFTNKSQGYEISYPESGQVAQAQTSGHAADVDPTDGACVSLKLPGGYVHILGKTRTDEQAAMCLRTGVGAEYSDFPDLQAEAFGKKYAAKGMGTTSASAGYKKSFYFFETGGGEKIEFGIEVNEKYAPEPTYDQAKAEVLAVLGTLKGI